ncbi:MAG TPA: DUF3592 domain-containing protein [Chthoniobacteraceae bacterium]|nr:DUF3592 domain-containing protein [Chthoniobacteraceae bacterium]
MAVAILRGASDAARLKDAAVVPARILDVHYSTATTGRNGFTTRIVQGKYSYSYNGRIYESERLTIHGYPADFYDRLKQAKDTGGNVPCFVDPQDPTLSVLNRNFAIWDKFLLAIGALIFLGMGVYSLKALADRPKTA